jgi:hypothetical protein
MFSVHPEDRLLDCFVCWLVGQAVYLEVVAEIGDFAALAAF